MERQRQRGRENIETEGKREGQRGERERQRGKRDRGRGTEGRETEEGREPHWFKQWPTVSLKVC